MLSSLARSKQAVRPFLGATAELSRTFGYKAQVKAPFKKVMACNRGEIAVRIMRATHELGMESLAIYSHEDRYTQHRFKADESYKVGEGMSPVAAYLAIDEIIDIAKKHGVEAVHPGYGFLSENATFAQKLADNGITFVGPTIENLKVFGDKTLARQAAIECGVPVVPGTDEACASYEEVKKFTDVNGFPVIIKAAFGGGGRGMRVVHEESELETSFGLCSSEALAAFGDGTCFVERFVEKPRHIEIQMLADKEGNVVHLYERDCSVQRRHQKVIEMAPSRGLPDELREQLYADAIKICKHVNYFNAGTVEFLIGPDNKHYFIEVNPRVQVEHTVTEEVTGVDIVRAQMRLAAGETLEDLGLTQDKIECNNFAMQCRITTEDPQKNFAPDSGVIQVYRAASGKGVRLDEGPGFTGANITPHYDSLLVKITCSDRDFDRTLIKMRRTLQEYRIRGIKTNIPFLSNVLNHHDFVKEIPNTSFIETHPEIMETRDPSLNRGTKLLRFLGDMAVNGPPKALGCSGSPVSVDPSPLPLSTTPKEELKGWRDVYKKDGPEAFAKAIREHPGLLLTDTSMRDAHQSLLATRVRTKDLKAVAPYYADNMQNLFSLENWGGATFDVAMRFLKEDPWERLSQLREEIPNIPFQMLLRGANAVGYTSYPDNLIYKFCEKAVDEGMDVFRIFDSLNYLENMKLGIDAVGAAGGIIEAAVCYTGDVARDGDNKYNLDYYLNLVRELKEMGTHILGIKDMAGLLKPGAARKLVGAIREEFPDLPIHVHTHDTACTGVASMVECAMAGADVVDAAMDSVSGMTSQPSLGALVAALENHERDTGIDFHNAARISQYWEECRGLYQGFESGQKAGSTDVFMHEMPGGQYTNLQFQANQLGLAGRWPAIKKAYAEANKLMGDIIKVTPSSKVVGDLAQFMVQNELSYDDVMEQAETLSFPQSVVEYFQGYLGIPFDGFPEPLRSKVLKGKKLPNGKDCFEGRPGAELPAFDFGAATKNAIKIFPDSNDLDVLSYAMYPQVFEEWKAFETEYGKVDFLPTRSFVEPMKPGDEVCCPIDEGKDVYIRLQSIGDVDENGDREVTFILNGERRVQKVHDNNAEVSVVSRAKADPNNDLHVGSPMPGVCVSCAVKVGDELEVGDNICTLSAMKMETVVTAKAAGKIKSCPIAVGDNLEGGDMLIEFE
eukprot:TRINITY_DN26_c0_g1_i2.p1 TRINITY_DN26_c0_g1~~TRINITY_DN26_c0_g1_i2.p1  ORF type:complete len:1184 (+),score=463.93 TRINITY_DN26_c0_g1_i2:119-3670(+)